MIDRFTARSFARIGLAVVISDRGGARRASAQDRLKSMPGYDQYQRMAPQIAQVAAAVTTRAFTQNGAAVSWTPDSKYVTYQTGGEARTYDVAARKTVDHAAPPTAQTPPAGRGRGRGVGRRRTGTRPPVRLGRRAGGKSSRDLPRPQPLARRLDGANDVADHDRRQRQDAHQVRHGQLGVRRGAGPATAMWWSPDSKKLAYYRFDESKVPDFYLTLNQTKVQDTLDVEAYPEAGRRRIRSSTCSSTTSPRRRRRTIDVRDGKPFDNDVVGHYVYRVDVVARRRELLFTAPTAGRTSSSSSPCAPRTRRVPRRRPRGVADAAGSTNRADDAVPRGRQALHLGVGAQRLEQLLPLRPQAGKLDRRRSRSIDVRGRRASCGSTKPRTTLFYMARDGDNYMKLQLHRVGLDGKATCG